MTPPNHVPPDPRRTYEPDHLAPGHWENDRWELYHLDEDFSENNDVAEHHPDKLAELQGCSTKIPRSTACTRSTTGGLPG